jgi:hypothetical protein
VTASQGCHGDRNGALRPARRVRYHLRSQFRGLRSSSIPIQNVNSSAALYDAIRVEEKRERGAADRSAFGSETV